MNEPVLFPNLAQAREQAAEWIARMDRGLDASESRELNQWRANPANARALRELGALWEDMDQLEVLAEVMPRRPAAAATRRRWPVALAACILVAGVAVFVLPSRFWRNPGATQSVVAAPARHATAIGEHRDVSLEDGSTLALNTDTVVEVSLQADARNLQLSRGEAHFTVAHDTARPFLVTVGHRTVRAVGTAFDIRRRAGDAMDLLVTEGVVRLGRTDGQPSPVTDPTELAAGQLLQVDAQGRMRLQKLDSGAQAAWLAWRNGMLLFAGETLEKALDEFSRYTTDRFSIPDTQLRSMRIGGYFPAGDTQALLNALGANFGLAARREADGRVVVTRVTAEKSVPH